MAKIATFDEKEQITYVTKEEGTVTAFGTGAHVLVPKEHIGKDCIVVIKEKKKRK